MGAPDLLNALRNAGLTVSADGDRLNVTGSPSALVRFRQAIREQKAALLALLKIGAGDTATSTWWRLHYPDRDPMEVSCTPPATHDDILEQHSDAVAAEPFAPTIRRPSAPLTVEDEAAIRAWLAQIEETDPAIIAEVVGQCQRDADAREYFTRLAGVI